MGPLVRSRKSWPFYLLVVLIVAALPVGWYVFLARPSPVPLPPPPPPAPEIVEAPQPVNVLLDELEGTVELRSPDGTWRAVTRGDALRSADVIRTGERSSAVLAGSDAWEVRMASGTEVTVGELTASIYPADAGQRYGDRDRSWRSTTHVRGPRGRQRCRRPNPGRRLRDEQRREGDRRGRKPRGRGRVGCGWQGRDRSRRSAIRGASGTGAQRADVGALEPVAQGEVAGPSPDAEPAVDSSLVTPSRAPTSR